MKKSLIMEGISFTCTTKYLDPDNPILNCNTLSTSKVPKQNMKFSLELGVRPIKCDTDKDFRFDQSMDSCMYKYGDLERCGCEELDPKKNPQVWGTYCNLVKKHLFERVQSDPKEVRLVIVASGHLLLEYNLMKYVFCSDEFQLWEGTLHLEFIDYKYEMEILGTYAGEKAKNAIKQFLNDLSKYIPETIQLCSEFLVNSKLSIMNNKNSTDAVLGYDIDNFHLEELKNNKLNGMGKVIAVGKVPNYKPILIQGTRKDSLEYYYFPEKDSNSYFAQTIVDSHEKCRESPQFTQGKRSCDRESESYSLTDGVKKRKTETTLEDTAKKNKEADDGNKNSKQTDFLKKVAFVIGLAILIVIIVFASMVISNFITKKDEVHKNYAECNKKI